MTEAGTLPLSDLFDLIPVWHFCCGPVAMSPPGTPATSQRDPVRSGYGGKPEEKCSG